ncbi:MAG: RIP metalloprotease RseP [Gammaproteobacteria bacterium]|nr:RIP metalloprotease RseP [Gammaproteobacteria bacterium]
MVDFVQAALALALALSVLIAFHEFGHYWVARRLGIRVLRYSIGFGRPLCHWWPRPGRLLPTLSFRGGAPVRPPDVPEDTSEFVIAALPLGGYVRMLDEREGEVPREQLHRAFNRQPPWIRIAVVAAGPIANLVFAVLAYWLAYLIGIPGVKPVVGEVAAESIAAQADLRSGDEIIAVAGKTTPTWESVMNATMPEIVRRARVVVEVTRAGGTARLQFDFGPLHIDTVSEQGFFAAIGARPKQAVLAPVIAAITPASPAERAGFRAGDFVIAADDTPIRDGHEWINYIRTRPEIPIRALVRNGDQTREVTVVPERISDQEGTFGRIGAEIGAMQQADGDDSMRSVERFGPVTALGKAIGSTWDMAALPVKLMWRMIFGEASTTNLSGPISIAGFASKSASLGFISFLTFLAVVSVGLAIINLLPIPLLDGGHLLFYLIESALGRPVPEAIQNVGQQVGLVILLGLMSLALYNDIMRII